MSAFYLCEYCDTEFLGPEEMPVLEDDPGKPICSRCEEGYEVCIVCEVRFPLDLLEGDPTGDLCTACWHRNKEARANLLSAIFES